MFENTYQLVNVNKIRCQLEFEKLPEQIRIKVLQLKNTLKLTNGMTVRPPILRRSGEIVANNSEFKGWEFDVLQGCLTVTAAQTLANEMTDYYKLWCLVVSKHEYTILKNLSSIQSIDF